MRILFVGNLNEHTRTFQRLQALRDLGHDVQALPTRQVPMLPGISPKPGIYERLFTKLDYPLDSQGINRAVRHSARDGVYDLLWVEKALMIRPATLRRFRGLQPGAAMAFYSEDDMYARHNQSAYFRRALPLYDVVYTTKSYNVDELPRIGARRVVFVNKAFSQYVHRPLNVTTAERERLGADVTFIGSYERERGDDLLHLARSGVEVRVWGNGWEVCHDRPDNLRIEGRPLYGDDYVKALCASKIALCFLRKLNRDQQTARTMEIPATGTFMLAERTGEHQQLFVEDREAVFFSDADELVTKVRFYLAHDLEREHIAMAGHQRCVSSGYSHRDRLIYMLGQIHV